MTGGAQFDTCSEIARVVRFLRERALLWKGSRAGNLEVYARDIGRQIELLAHEIETGQHRVE